MTFVDIWHLFKSLLLALYEKTAHTVSNQKEKVQFFVFVEKYGVVDGFEVRVGSLPSL